MKVFAGLIIVLIAWLVIDLLMKVLTGGDFGVWNDVPCAPYQEGPALGQYNPPPVGGSAGGPGPGWTSTPPQTPIQWTAEREAAVRAQFQAAGIPINKAACPDGSANCPGGGTSVGNLQSSTLNYALALRQACSNCEVVVTGGTEWGGADPHAHGPLSHISGHKIDFRTTQGLNEYVQRRVADGRFVQQPQRLGTYIDVSTTGSGTVWRNEGDHWDVCVRCVTRANP